MFKNADIGIDLGNSKFSLCIKREGVVVSEAAYLAYTDDHASESSIVAVGDEALEMYEHAPSGVHVITPMREGRVIDCRLASLILNRLAKKAGFRRRWSRPRALIATLYGSSNVERKAFVDVANTLSFGRSFAVHEPLAAANALGIDISGPSANMVIDVGDGATEALAVSMGQTILGTSMRFGGHDVDMLLIEHIRKKHNIAISRSRARHIKERLSLVGPSATFGDDISVKGISVERNLPVAKCIAAADFQAVVDHVAEKISAFTLDTLARLPPEASIDLIEHGLYLCGGASRMARLKERITEKTNLNVKAMEEPQHAVIEGLHQMLDFSHLFA